MALKLTIDRLYKDDQRSFLAVFTVTGGQTEDDNKIFVCGNDYLVPGVTETPGQQVGVYVLCESSSSAPSPMPEEDVFGCGSLDIYPNRVLQTIASIEDMEFFPADAPEEEDKTGYYRANTVAVMTRSLDMLNCVIDLIYGDIQLHCNCRNFQTPDLEVHVAQTCTEDDTRQYLFPE